MKVEVDIKITLLEGKEKGRTLYDKHIMETETEHTEYGIVEKLTILWRFMHDYIEGKDITDFIDMENNNEGNI